MKGQKACLEDANREIARLREQVRTLEAELAKKQLHPPMPEFGAIPLGQNYSKDQMAAILESMPSAVVIISASGRLIYVNRRAHELYGTDYVGVEIADHVLQVKALRPDGAPYPVEALPATRSIQNGETVQNEEMIIQRSNGQRLTVLVSSAPLFDSEGNVAATVVSFRDISERKQAEDALKAALETAEARTRELEAVVGSVPDGLAVFEQEGRLVFMNETGRQLTSLFMTPPDPAAGKTELNAYDENGKRVHPEEEAVHRIFTRGETIQESIYSTAPDREPVTWIALSGAPIRDEGGTISGAVVLSRDITRHRKVERTIAFQSHLLDSVQDAIIATDGAFHITYWNHASEALLGWTPAEAMGQSSLALLNPIVVAEPSLDEAIDRLWATDTYIGEVVYHHKDGTEIIVDNSAHLIRDEQGSVRETITTMRDIRKRKQWESDLLESERKYRDLVRFAPTGIFEYDIVNRRFISVNDSMTELTGYSMDELMDMDPMAMTDEATRQFALGRIRRWELGETLEQEVEHTWITKDGRHIHIALNTTFSQFKDGRPSVMTAIAHNVTERKQLELALLRQAEELLAADRNKNQFLNMLSHELRNPLAAIIASVDLVAHFNADAERTRRAVRVLQRQAGHLAHIVDDLLDVTRITTGKVRLNRQPSDIVGLVRQTVSDLQAQYAAKGVALTAELPDEPIVLELDSVRMTQAIVNLMHNALKFTPAGGKVSVAAALENRSPEPGPAGLNEPEAVVPEIRITVADSGAGIEPGILPHIFEPFSQAEQPLARTHGGLGLGLAIVKGMVELHGGRVDAESGGEGKGATFIIWLPATGCSGCDTIVP